MGNVVCKSNLSEVATEDEDEGEQLKRLSLRHHAKSVSQLIEEVGLQGRESIRKWHESFLQMRPEWGELEWDRGIHGNRDMRNLIRIEYLDDMSQVSPNISMLNGILIRQKLAHPGMRKEIKNPVILVSLNCLERLDPENISFGFVLDAIRDVSPDIVITQWRPDEHFVDCLRDANISLVSEVHVDIISDLERVLMDRERVKLKEGFEYFIGSCEKFSVQEASQLCKDSSMGSQDVPDVYKKPCCAIQLSKPVYKSLLLSYHGFLDIAKLSEIAYTLMLGLCWKFLEISFLTDYFRCQDDLSLFQEFVSEANSRVELELPVNVYSVLGSLGYGSLAEKNYSEDLGTCHQVFRATTFCFNPEKQFFCESPHFHCVEMYSSKDLSILEYMIEASPRDIKCSHHDCGYDACIHKRTFVANNAAITISSTHLQGDSKEDENIYMWIEHGESLSEGKRVLSSTSCLLSITHLLRLMICSNFSHPKPPFESKLFCIKKRDVVMTFSIKLVEPFEFIYPSEGNEKEEKVVKNWVLNELRHLQESLTILEGSSSEDAVNILRFKTDLRLLDLLKDSIVDLRKKFLSLKPGRTTTPLELYLELDAVHYIHRLAFAILTSEEDIMYNLGSKQFLSLHACGDPTESGSEGSPRVGPQLHAGEYDIDKSSDKCNAFESSMLRDIIVLMQDIPPGNRDIWSAEPGNSVKLPPPDRFLWDGEHWRFLRGDIHCSIIACFLSTRIYDNFVHQTVKVLSPGVPTDWKTVASGSAETCKIVVGDTLFEAFRAVQFHALRETYVKGGNDAFFASLQNCEHWSSSGGKSNVYFAKSTDGKYIIKQITASEKASFGEFAGDYFAHMVSTHGSHTCLAKILGMFKVSYSSTKSKRETLDLIIVENVFYCVAPEEAYDLKGLPRVLDGMNLAEPQQKVLLDGNLRSKIRMDPLFVSLESLDRLAARMKIDTGFLSNMNVMDYSLLVGINRKDRKIIVGIIDYIRGYTLDKHIESWVKLLRRPGEEPTVISPQQYAARFQDQILAYFTSVPSN